MKKLFIAALLLSNVYLFAQNSPVRFQLKQFTPTTMQKPTLNTPAFTFTQLHFYVKNDFSVYNRTTMFNDNFTLHKGKVEYKNSIMIPENLLSNVKMDSFNPNAADSIESALFTGTLTLLAGLFNNK